MREELASRALREIAGARVEILAVFLDDEIAGALNGDVGRHARRLNAALREVGADAGDTRADTFLDGVAVAARSNLLIKEILELRVLALEPNCVQVGEVVGNDG